MPVVSNIIKGASILVSHHCSEFRILKLRTKEFYSKEHVRIAFHLIKIVQ
jgi:hypothetical protein